MLEKSCEVEVSRLWKGSSSMVPQCLKRMGFGFKR